MKKRVVIIVTALIGISGALFASGEPHIYAPVYDVPGLQSSDSGLYASWAELQERQSASSNRSQNYSPASQYDFAPGARDIPGQENPYEHPYAGVADLPGQVPSQVVQGGDDITGYYHNSFSSGSSAESVYKVPTVAPPVPTSRRPTTSSLVIAPKSTGPAFDSRQYGDLDSIVDNQPLYDTVTGYGDHQRQDPVYIEAKTIDTRLNNWMQQPTPPTAADEAATYQTINHLQKEASTDTDPYVQAEEKQTLSLWQRFINTFKPKKVVPVQAPKKIKGN